MVLKLKSVWHDLRDGPSVLRGIDLTVNHGERLALMGRNGAGKSTLLKHVGGLMEPTRGKVQTAGRVALLLQNPSDYLVHDRVAAETTPAALARFGLSDLADQHPRDLSGGQRQRLALAIVLGDPDLDAPALICLDEPTRGMDREVKRDLVQLIRGLEGAVLVATHDPEFAAAFADRVILMGTGTVVADAPARELLSGGTYFSTETARILGGAGGVLLPGQGATLLTPASEVVAR